MEIGAIKINNDGEVSSFQTLVKPNYPISAFNESIHGISNEMVKDAPLLSSVFDAFMDFISGTSLYGHNVKFDCGFLISKSKNLQKSLQKHDVFDTCLLSRYVSKIAKIGLTSHKLGKLTEFYNIENPSYHRAFNDSLMSLKLFMKLIDRIELLTDPNSLIDLLRLKSFVFSLSSDGEENDYKAKRVGMSEQEFKVLSVHTLNQTPIFISYEKGSFGPTPRPIRPMALLPLNEGLVLNAECLITNQIKNFKIRHISAVSVKE